VTPGHADYLAVPDAGSRLTDGVVVEANVVARLLGMKLLRLEADIVLAPAELRAASALAEPGYGSPAGHEATWRLIPGLEPHATVESDRRVPEAARLLREAEASLASARATR